MVTTEIVVTRLNGIVFNLSSSVVYALVDCLQSPLTRDLVGVIGVLKTVIAGIDEIVSGSGEFHPYAVTVMKPRIVLSRLGTGGHDC